MLALAVILLLSQRKQLAGIWAEDATWQRIRRDGVLRVGMDASYPPFEDITEEDQFIGLDVELARTLASRWGVEVAFVNVHFDGLYDALATDKFDLIISALPYDRTMTRDLLYSYSYFNAGQFLLVNEALAQIDGIEELRGGRLAVELGAEGHQLARQLSRDRGLGFEIQPQREMDAAVALVVDGEADGLLCDRVTAHELLRTYPKLHLVGASLTDEPLVIAAPMGAHRLISEVNAALVEWNEDGVLEQLMADAFAAVP